MEKIVNRIPGPDEYPAFYAPYIQLVGEENIIEYLTEQSEHFITCLVDIPEEMGDYRYENGKWSIKELVGHIIDCERIMAFRAMSISRGEQQMLPGFEQDDYVKKGDFANRTLLSLIEEFETLRVANLSLFKSFSEEMLFTIGYSNGKEISVSALLYIIGGHLQHHLNILNKKYLTLIDE